MMNAQSPPEQPPTLTAAAAPPLWNPNAAGCWSLLFTPAFGAYLHAQNAKSLGRDAEAKGNLTTFYLNLVYVVFALISIIFIPSIPQAAFTGTSIALLISWYVSFCKKQAQYVKETYGENYQRKSWGMPLLIGFAGLIVFFAIGFVLELIANPESRPQ